MIKATLRRGLGAAKRRAGKVLHHVRMWRVRRVDDFGWVKEAARAVDVSETSLRLETDDSDWGYQLRSQAMRVPRNCWAVITLQGRLHKGTVSLGFLDAAGTSWIENHILPAGRIYERLLVDPRDSGAMTLVFSNAKGGESSLEVTSLTLEWMPQKLARAVGNTEASIVAEMNEVRKGARPFALETDGTPSPDNKICGVGVYLRTDYWVKIKAGGSYGHTCYVAQELARCTERLVCFTASRFDMLDDMRLEQVVMDAPAQTCNEMDVLRASRFYYDWLHTRIAALQPKYIYERAILGSYVGARLSRELGIPYILEYNGSEISLRRSFDERGYEMETAFTLAEEAAFAQATTIVVISDIIAEGLLKRGIPREKILVNPNGCSPDHYQPLAQAAKREQRRALGWDDEHCVVGFIGTFGGWHGIDVLAEALPAICARNPNIRFLLIGDGNFRNLVVEAVEAHGLGDRVHLPGIVPQASAGKLLACSDILISPHSRHMVDSRFFGSPTKLFEYMALAGAIVASDLEQIGEILRPAFTTADLNSMDGRGPEGMRGVLCRPGDAQDFTEAVVALAHRPELWSSLGRNAREALVENYTWEHHVAKILKHVAARSAHIKVHQ